MNIRAVTLFLCAVLGSVLALPTAHSEDAIGFERVEERVFRAKHDGSQQKYVVMTPRGFAADKGVSILIALHGHGSNRWQFVRQSRGECRATRDVASAHKMLLISPDYRAKTSWMGPAAEADVLQIIRELKARFHVDRVILCGGSMGGTGALTFATLHSKMIDGVVSLNGTANLVDYTRFQDAITESYGGSKEQVPQEYRKRSAEFFPERFTMPLAATTGGRDEIVPPQSVLRLLRRVRTHNKSVLSIHRPRGGHSTSYEDTKRALEFVIAEKTAPGEMTKIPQQVSAEGAAYLKRLLKGQPWGAKEFNLEQLRAGMKSRRLPTIKGVKLIAVKAGDVPCEWVLAPGADPNVRLLYLHGGGFVSGSGAYYLPLAAHISAAAKCAVLLPDYRLAPEHRFPAGVNDCVAAHQWMMSHGPSGARRATATFIAGDSAGGSLTLATMLALRDRRLPLPAGGIPISATTDLTLASKSLKTVHDPIISARTMPKFRDLYLGKQDPRHPLASPVFGSYKGIPPLLIQVGEHEMLRDDSIRVAAKARADGVKVQLEIWRGMFHVFQSHEPLLPEAKQSIQHMARFIRSQLPKP